MNHHMETEGYRSSSLLTRKIKNSGFYLIVLKLLNKVLDCLII